MRRIAIARVQVSGFRSRNQRLGFWFLDLCSGDYAASRRLVSSACLGRFFVVNLGAFVPHAALSVDDPLGEVVGVVGFTEDNIERALLFFPSLEKGVVHELHAE